MDPWTDPDEPPPALGVVLDDDRGSLPYSLVHGEALVAAAAWALGEAGVTLVDATVEWAGFVEAAEPLVLHDSLCPLTPPDFIAACVRRAVWTDAVVVGVRAVTDTVKDLEPDDAGVDPGSGQGGAWVGATVDRDALVTVCSPLVLPASRVAALDGLPTTDLAALVDLLAAGGEVIREAAPATARRVAGPDDVRLLEALTRPERPTLPA